MDEQRLIDLETKFAHQDFAIEQMQQALFDQQLLITKLEHRIQQLEADIGGNEIGPGNQKPPHY